MADFLALHGFTQRGAMWDEVASLVGGEWDTPDLPGHGDEPPLGWAEAVEWVTDRVESAGPGLTLVGYSMGGRLALAAALARPSGLERLVLISTAMGIADQRQRERRRAEDERTAERIERIGLDLFLTEWLASPMFSGLGRRPAAWGMRDLRLRGTNNAPGLAASIRLLGQGSQPSLASRVVSLEMPLVTVAGSDDEIYVAHSRRMADAAPRGTFIEVPGAGHSVVGEDPAAIARLLAGSSGVGA